MVEGFHIRAAKFPVLPGEDELAINPGTHGRALAEYLKTRLEERGFEVPFVCSEDFGWWIQIKLSGIAVGVICCRAHGDPGIADFGIALPSETRRWSWRRLRFVDLTGDLENLSLQIQQILESDGEIEVVANDLDSYASRDGGFVAEQDTSWDEQDGFEVRPQNRWFTIFGSRVLFILLAPCLLIAVALSGAMMLGSFEGIFTSQARSVAGVLALLFLSVLLMGISPRHFGWMIVIITTAIPTAYCWYFVDTYIVEGRSLAPTGSRSDVSPWNALMGFLVFGVPFLIFTYRRMKSWLSGGTK